MSAAAPQYNLGHLQSARRTLEARFDQFARQVRARLLLEEAARWIALMAAVGFATFILDRTLRLSGLTRRGLLIALLATAIIQAWRWLLRPLRLKLRSDLLASALERSAGQPIAARTATILQLPSSDPQAVSEPMVASAVTRSSELLEGINFSDYLDPRRRRIAATAIALTILFSSGLILTSPASARLWAARLFAGSNQPWPQRTFLDVAGLADRKLMQIPRGETFVLRAMARSGTVSPDTILVHWRQGGAAPVEALLTRFGTNDFRYDFPAIQTDATVELSGGDDVVGPFVIHPVDRPRIVDLRLTGQHPTEKKPQIHNFSGDDAGDMSFLPLTKLELSFIANTPVAVVHLTSSTTQPSPANVRRIDDRHFAVAWEHSAATQLQIELTGTEAALTSAPTNVAIGLKTDKPPRVTLGFTGVHQRITALATIPLVAEARDDYGIDHVELRIKTEIAESEDATTLKTTATTRPIFGPSTRPDDPLETEVRQAHSLHVPDLQLQPGHALTLAAAATDNCYPQPQTSASRNVIFHVVRPEELFKEILARQQSERAKFRKQVQEAQAIRQGMGLVDTSDAVA